LILVLSRAHHGAQNAVVHELDDGTTLVWELLDAEPEDELLGAPVQVQPGWLMRHDRIDFPPGGIAYRHTHPGPGIRYLLHGAIRIESGSETHDYGPGEPWFESGPEPVFAQAASDRPSRFIRVMILPRALLGKSSLQFVDAADAAKPRVQQYKIFADLPIARPRG